MNVPRMPSRQGLFSIQASRALQRAFAPITKESFATYLFSPTPRVPSSSFSESVVLHSTQRFTHSGLADPGRAFRMPIISYRPTTETASVHFVLTPLKREGNTLLGILSLGGFVPAESILPFPGALMAHGVQRGRFVYDIQKRQMVAILDGMRKDMLVVASARWFGEGASLREKFFFGVPKRDYSFDDMPKLATVVLSNIEYQISKPRDDQSTSDDSTTASDSLFRNFTQEQAQTALEVRQSFDSFDMSAMNKVIENLATELSGVYYGPKLKRDIINISTGELSSRASGKMVIRLSIPDQVEQSRVRRMVAQDYFLQLLPPGTECWFSQNAGKQQLGIALSDFAGDEDVVTEESVLDDEPLPDVYHFDSVSGSSSAMDTTGQTSTSSGEPLLMSNMGMSSTATPFPVQQAFGSGAEEGLTEAELKRRKDEERRKRNRLSAARSNERRREREKAQKKELEMLKTRKILLEGVEQRLIDENEALRGWAERLE